MTSTETVREKLYKELKEEVSIIYREAWMKGFNCSSFPNGPEEEMEKDLADWMERES